VVLAPMAGVTDAPFRRLCASFGGGLFVNQMGGQDELVFDGASYATNSTHGERCGLVGQFATGYAKVTFDPSTKQFVGLENGCAADLEGWAAELTELEASALRDAVADLVAQHQGLVDQLMEEESIELELERDPWWLAIEGDRGSWSLRVVLTPAAGQRAVEGGWSVAAARPFSQALQQLFGQP